MWHGSCSIMVRPLDCMQGREGICGVAGLGMGTLQQRTGQPSMGGRSGGAGHRLLCHVLGCDDLQCHAGSSTGAGPGHQHCCMPLSAICIHICGRVHQCTRLTPGLPACSA